MNAYRFSCYKLIKDDKSIWRTNILMGIDHTDHFYFICHDCHQECEIKLEKGYQQKKKRGEKGNNAFWILLKCRCFPKFKPWRKMYSGTSRVSKRCSF